MQLRNVRKPLPAMIQVKTTAITYLNNSSFDAKARAIYIALRDSASPFFANPPVPLATLEQAVATFQALLIESMGGSHDAMNRRNTQRMIVTEMLFSIGQWAAYEVRREANAATLLESIGFVAAKEKRIRVTELATPGVVSAHPSREPGAIEISFAAVPYAQCYSIEIAEKNDLNPASWKHFRLTTTVRCRLEKLERGKFYYVRVRAYHGKAGYSAPSSVAMCLAG